ncbi:MAG: hypothetical protein QXG36_07775 [Nitrososphaeria archaeon]
MLEVEITTSSYCNLFCKHCYIDAKFLGSNEPFFLKNSEYDKTYLSSYFDRVFDFIRYTTDREKTSDIVHFMIMGGEPTLIGIDLFEFILEKIYSIGDKKGLKVSVGTSTNCLLLNESWLDFFSLNKEYINLSIAYDFSIRFYSSLLEDQWWRNVQAIRERGLPFALNLTLTRHLVKSDVFSLISKIEPYRVDIGSFLPVGRGRIFMHELGLSTEELANFYIYFFNEVRSRYFDLSERLLGDFLKVASILKERQSSLNSWDDFFKNCWGKCWRRLIVDLKGNLYLECTYPNSIGSIFDDFGLVFLSREFLNFYKSKCYRKECFLCDFYDFCKGGCVALFPLVKGNECVGLKKLLTFLQSV